MSEFIKGPVLILGSTSDIARAFARECAALGLDLDLAARNLAEAKRDAADLSIRYGIKARAHFFDALDFKSHARFYSKLPVKPNGVFLAFGVLGDQDKAEEDFSEAERILHSNFTGAVSILDCVAKDFRTRSKKSVSELFIAGLSSVAGDRGRGSNYFYGSAKAALTAYLSGLRNKLAPRGIHVLTIKPGFVETKMTEGLKLPPLLTASPEEVARVSMKAILKNKDVVYVKWMWRWIMLIIIHLPEFVFKKLKL